jgi:hypothetical protein
LTGPFVAERGEMTLEMKPLSLDDVVATLSQGAGDT